MSKMIIKNGTIASFEEIGIYEKRKQHQIYLDNKRTYFICKRIFDAVVALVVIVLILSWLVPVIALLIKLDSRGPVFFLQRRVGRNGGTFICNKFRTMIINPDADKKQAVDNDERITRVGKFLRRSGLDEFPQFLNVLLGDMSLVGPRPHMHADYDRFSSLIPLYEFRNLVKPGITGLAQVKGFSGPVADHEDIFGRYQWDAFYVRNASFWLDLRIIRQTALKQLTGFQPK
jgi:putative colanic acid biosynthesis UDP-glucose lipid carrier transferase